MMNALISFGRKSYLYIDISKSVSHVYQEIEKLLEH